MKAATRASIIIIQCDEAAINYSADPNDRLAYEVGCLRAQIRELCAEAEFVQDELKAVQAELMWEQKHGH